MRRAGGFRREMGRLFATLRRLRSAAAALAILAAALAAAAGFTPLDPRAQVRAMGRGVNILSDDPFWEPHGAARFRARHFRIIRRGGFRTVRINLQAFCHMDSDGRLDRGQGRTVDFRISVVIMTSNSRSADQLL